MLSQFIIGFVFFTIIDNIRMETTGRNFWALINLSSLVCNTGKAQPRDAVESLQSHWSAGNKMKQNKQQSEFKGIEIFALGNKYSYCSRRKRKYDLVAWCGWMPCVVPGIILHNKAIIEYSWWLMFFFSINNNRYSWRQE